ncbi:DUF4862 family protein [Serratia fonticola]
MENTTPGFIIGAYPCAPSFHQLEREKEVQFWDRLAELPLIRGLEQPCLDELHPYGDDFLLKQIPSHWQLVLTAVMGTMQRRGSGRDFGLAARNEEERQAAVDYIRSIHDKVKRTNDHAGRQQVVALELQSAPNLLEKDSAAARQAFIASLEDIAGWHWECDLVIEHCDALTGPKPRKGFLTLEDEIIAAQAINRHFGDTLTLAINWGRSAIEGHNDLLPLQQVKQCQQAGLLSALMFSGTASHGAYGEWEDTHAPFAPFDGSHYVCHESLMTLDSARQLFNQAPLAELNYAGIKLLSTSAQESIEQRIAIIKDGINALALSSGLITTPIR